MTPLGVVFDAVTFVQAIANSNGPAAACWQRVQSGELTQFSSEATLAELTDVVSRPKIVKKLKLDGEVVRTFLDSIRQCSTVLDNVPSSFEFARDPKDEPLLNLAIAARAQYLVTWDQDLLDLMHSANADYERLRMLAPNLTILTPPELLQLLRAT